MENDELTKKNSITIVARLSRLKNQAKLMNRILPLTSCLTTA